MTNDIKTKSFKGQLGGARPGAGRPIGSKSTMSISGLLRTIEDRTHGRTYEEILVDDFLEARRSNDTALVLKYHQLILNKVMNTLTKVEINENIDSIEAKQAAFAIALSQLIDKK